MVNKRSSGGFPHFKKKGDLHNVAFQFFGSILREDVDPEIFSRPCIVHRVLQPGDNEIKNR